jgi:hypothetical protein
MNEDHPEIPEFNVIIFQCCICRRGMIQQGFTPVPFWISPFTYYEYCRDHRPFALAPHSDGGASH